MTTRKPGCSIAVMADRREVQRRYHANRVRRRREEFRERIRVFKSERGCIDCGIRDWRVLDFDHCGDKEFTIGAHSVKGYGWDRIQREIDKCDVRCANCHRIKTFERSRPRCAS